MSILDHDLERTYGRGASLAPTRLYVCGKMAGVDLYNFPAFDEARDRLTKAGYVVLSPADIDRAWGFNGAGELPQWFDRGHVLIHDLNAIDTVEGIALLEGWQYSEGAAVELAYSKTTGKRINTVEGWMYLADHHG